MARSEPRFTTSRKGPRRLGGTILRPVRARSPILAAGAAGLAVALWWRHNPSACPYNQRFWIQAPHPLITRARLREALELHAGERVLEVGPGTGYYTLEVAEWLGAEGQLEGFDLPR